MVIFADKGRPLKPKSRISIAGLLLITLVLLRELFETLMQLSTGSAIWALAYSILFTAVAATVILHVVMLDWRETVIVVLLAGILEQFFLADTWQQFLLSWLAVSAGVFILPFADPKVRTQEKKLPKLRYIIAAAFSLAAVVLLIDVLFFASRTGISFYGLSALILGGIIALTLVALGYIITLAHQTYWGSSLGGTGLLTAIILFIAWLVLGAPWFP